MLDKGVKWLAEEAYSLGQNHIYNGYLRIYNRSNEELSKIFKKYDVKNKEVLTVLASSDQLFSCFYEGAKSIDTFDRVYATLYYYYLRKWLILYKNKFYPSIDFFENGDKKIYDLVCKIEPKDSKEREAKLFWMEYLQLNKYKADQFFFDVADVNRDAPFHDEMKKIKEIFNQKLNFTCMDMLSVIPIRKKYDVVILSNMLEYVHDVKGLLKFRDNIESLLKEDGIAICSNKKYSNDSSEHKKEVEVLTSNHLVEDASHQYYESLFAHKQDLAYSYKLKRM